MGSSMEVISSFGCAFPSSYGEPRFLNTFPDNFHFTFSQTITFRIARVLIEGYRRVLLPSATRSLLGMLEYVVHNLEFPRFHNSASTNPIPCTSAVRGGRPAAPVPWFLHRYHRYMLTSSPTTILRICIDSITYVRRDAVQLASRPTIPPSSPLRPSRTFSKRFDDKPVMTLHAHLFRNQLGDEQRVLSHCCVAKCELHITCRMLQACKAREVGGGLWVGRRLMRLVR